MIPGQDGWWCIMYDHNESRRSDVEEICITPIDITQIILIENIIFKKDASKVVGTLWTNME